MALVQFATPDLAGNDGYYHIKLAYLMRTEGLKPDFTYLPLSILNSREFYDHHFLFHVGLFPFTFGDLRLGAKWGATVFGVLALLSGWRLLRNQRVPYASLWAFGLLALSEAFIFRMSIPRAQSLSLALLLLAFDLLLRREWLKLGLLSAIYVWLYNAFPLIIVLAAAYAAATLLLEGTVELRPVAYAGAGVTAGLLINPYFPYNVVFVLQHILPKLQNATAISVGSEWFPYETAQLLENSPLALAAFMSAVLALGLNKERMDRRTLTSMLLVGAFGLMLFQSRRFIEYFPPFSLVFAAFAWAPLIHRQRATVDGGREGRQAVSGASKLKQRLRAYLPPLLMAAIILPGTALTFAAARVSVASAKSYRSFAGSAAWLQANTEPGTRVFQTDWDDFTRLFFYNTHNTYLIGLDPTYMSLYDAELYETWVAITRGRVERPSAVIGTMFAAEYVVSDLNHTEFLEQAALDPGLVESYRDSDSVVFRVERAPSRP